MGRTIFRESALEAYRRGLEKDVVPRLISWPIVLCFWVLLGALIAGAIVSWYVRVPSYVDAAGIVVARGHAPRMHSAAVLFLRPDQAKQIRAGLRVDVQLDATGGHTRRVITRVEGGVASPSSVRRRYHVDPGTTDPVAGPAKLVFVRLGRAYPVRRYAGSLVTAQVTVGSQPLIALFPEIGKLLSGS